LDVIQIRVQTRTQKFYDYEARSSLLLT
jgi:hypothetical protein